MSDNVKFRTCEKFSDGEWVEVEFEDLEEGDTFRLFENGIQIVEAIAESVPEEAEPDGNYSIIATECRS